MEKFTRFDGPNIAGTDGNKSYRPSAAVDKLNLVSDTVFVNMHHGSHVSTIQFVVGRVAVQYHERVFSNHLSSSKSESNAEGLSENTSLSFSVTFA